MSFKPLATVCRERFACVRVFTSAQLYGMLVPFRTLRHSEPEGGGLGRDAMLGVVIANFLVVH
jgi:hypothetical protein